MALDAGAASMRWYPQEGYLDTSPYKPYMALYNPQKLFRRTPKRQGTAPRVQLSISQPIWATFEVCVGALFRKIDIDRWINRFIIMVRVHIAGTHNISRCFLPISTFGLILRTSVSVLLQNHLRVVPGTMLTPRQVVFQRPREAQGS